MTQDKIISLARENCPYTKELLRGAYYEGFVKAANLIASHVYTKNHNPDVNFNDDGTFSLTLPDGDELRIIPPQQEPVVKYYGEKLVKGSKVFALLDRDLAPDTLLYAAPVRTKDLTDGEIQAAIPWVFANEQEIRIARAVIAADREKNK